MNVRAGLPAPVGSLGLAVLLLFAPSCLQAQRPVTLRDALAAALAAPRMAVAVADSVLARAQLRTAHAFPNPNLNLSWTTSAPTRHYELEQPLEYPWVRAARIRAAASGLSAAGYLLAAERAAVRFDVEATYARAAAAREIRRLSGRNLRDADELVRIAAARRNAGDASELDVELAGVTAGQARNTFLTDSLAEITGLLDLQTLMGIEADRVTITLADSLDAVPIPVPPVPSRPVRVLAAEAQLRQQQATATETRFGRIPVPAIRGGWESGDDAQPGRLPMFGFSLAIPLWNRGGGSLAQANAAATRARGALALAQLETRAALARAERERALARDKVTRDRTMVRDAERVAELSLRAYHEGAYPLASVLEAQRNARDALRQFVQDLLEARTAEAAWVLAVTAGADTGSAPPAGGQTDTGGNP